MKTALLLILLSTVSAWGIDSRFAVAGIVGEAAGLPFKDKMAVACAIRNRGTLQGVYGVNARHNATEPQWVWRDAERAWRESVRHDITHGATHFGNLDDVRKGTFRGMILCYRTEREFFFKRA